MPTYEIVGPDHRRAIIVAPAGVSADEATAFAQDHWASWRDGGRYEMVADDQASGATHVMPDGTVMPGATHPGTAPMSSASLFGGVRYVEPPAAPSGDSGIDNLYKARREIMRLRDTGAMPVRDANQRISDIEQRINQLGNAPASSAAPSALYAMRPRVGEMRQPTAREIAEASQWMTSGSVMRDSTRDQLTPRQQEAERMASWLMASGWTPDLIQRAAESDPMHGHQPFVENDPRIEKTFLATGLAPLGVTKVGTGMLPRAGKFLDAQANANRSSPLYREALERARSETLDSMGAAKRAAFDHDLATLPISEFRAKYPSYDRELWRIDQGSGSAADWRGYKADPTPDIGPSKLRSVPLSTKYRDVPDADVVKRARTGDTDAFGELFAREKDRVIGTLRNLGFSPETAEEAAGKTWVALREGKIRDYDPAGKRFGNWVIDIARGKAKDIAERTTNRSRPNLRARANEAFRDMSAEANGARASREFTEALTAEERAVMNALDRSGDTSRASQSEAAKLLGISEAKVSRIVARIKEKAARDPEVWEIGGRRTTPLDGGEMATRRARIIED